MLPTSSEYIFVNANKKNHKISIVGLFENLEPNVYLGIVTDDLISIKILRVNIYVVIYNTKLEINARLLFSYNS